MRVMVCLFLLLAGCATHAVRCDGRLVPINPPAAGAAASSASNAVRQPTIPSATPPTRRDP